MPRNRRVPSVRRALDEPTGAERIARALSLDDPSMEWSVTAKTRRHYTSTAPLAFWGRRQFTMVGKAALEDLAKFKLTGNELTLFLLMCAWMQHGGLIEATHEQFAEKMGTSRPRVSSSMKRLMAVGLVHRVGNGQYLLHPKVAFHGNGDQQAAAVMAFPEELRSYRGSETLEDDADHA